MLQWGSAAMCHPAKVPFGCGWLCGCTGCSLEWGGAWVHFEGVTPCSHIRLLQNFGDPTHQPVIMSRRCLGVSKGSAKSLVSIGPSANCATKIRIDDPAIFSSLAQNLQHAHTSLTHIRSHECINHFSTFLVDKMHHF